MIVQLGLRTSGRETAHGRQWAVGAGIIFYMVSLVDQGCFTCESSFVYSLCFRSVDTSKSFNLLIFLNKT